MQYSFEENIQLTPRQLLLKLILLYKPNEIIVLTATLNSLFLLLFLGGVATLNSGFGASVLGLLVSAKAEVGL